MQTVNAPDLPPLIIGGVEIRTDAQGRYRLNDLHRASGGAQKDKPVHFLALESTKEMIALIRRSIFTTSEKINDLEPISVINSFTEVQGTYAIKVLVYKYATWISSEFFLHVVTTYDALVTGQLPGPNVHAVDQRFKNEVNSRFEKIERRLGALPPPKRPYAKRFVGYDENVINAFWAGLALIEQALFPETLNHYGRNDPSGYVAYNMTELFGAAQRLGIPLPDRNLVKRHLRGSTAPAFVSSNHAMRSRIRRSQAMRCWVFVQ